VLIEAFHVLSKRLKNLELRIVGDGEMREELMKRILFKFGFTCKNFRLYTVLSG